MPKLGPALATAVQYDAKVPDVHCSCYRPIPDWPCPKMSAPKTSRQYHHHLTTADNLKQTSLVESVCPSLALPSLLTTTTLACTDFHWDSHTNCYGYHQITSLYVQAQTGFALGCPSSTPAPSLLPIKRALSHKPYSRMSEPSASRQQAKAKPNFGA